MPKEYKLKDADKKYFALLSIELRREEHKLIVELANKYKCSQTRVYFNHFEELVERLARKIPWNEYINDITDCPCCETMYCIDCPISNYNTPDDSAICDEYSDISHQSKAVIKACREWRRRVLKTFPGELF